MPAAIIIYKYGEDSKGKGVNYYKIENANGASVTLNQLGASIVSIRVPDKNGELRDVVLGYQGLEGYEYDGAYFGATVGRCCGRIRNGKFTLNNKEYHLTINDKPNHLHGGMRGFSRRIWDARVRGDDVIFFLKVDNNDEGYPGNMTVEARFSFDDSNVLTVEYSAVSDQDTLCNITSHSYFNLNGHTNGSINNNSLKFNANSFIPVDNTLIPTGEIRKVENTAFDFRNFRKISDGLAQGHEQIDLAKGYDHSFVIDKKENTLGLCATAVSEESGIKLECYSTQPIVHLYTGNYVHVKKGKKEASYLEYSGFCFETQGYPDAINHPEFPSNVLKANEKYKQTTKFAFSVI